MTQKIDKLTFESADKSNLFYNGPGEFLVKAICDYLKASPWTDFFGEAIDDYRRMDYSHRQLPALRIYSPRMSKEYDSWFVDGDIRMDVILPSDIRRRETQVLQDTIASALLQEFRRPDGFAALAEIVPGLNELGKRYDANKDLGFEWQDQIVPLTQITMNFRVDLRIWDDYLEKTDRTKESPFTAVLGDLRQIVTDIAAVPGEDGSEEVVEVQVGIDQEIEE